MFVVLGITIFSQHTSFAATDVKDSDSEPLTASEKQARALAVYAPRPAYPLDARRNRYTGSGVALLKIDNRTGYVTSATMLKSIGHKILDDAVLAAFRRWRFKPGGVDKVRVPIAFTMRGAPAGEPGALAIYAARPQYPYEARARGLTGRGLVLLDVNPQTGYVTSARMLQITGHKILDDAAVEAFRQWRFKSGTVTKVKIPITFTMTGATYRWPYATHIKP
jgi:TonB family C-terminal domain